MFYIMLDTSHTKALTHSDPGAEEEVYFLDDLALPAIVKVLYTYKYHGNASNRPDKQALSSRRPSRSDITDSRPNMATQ